SVPGVGRGCCATLATEAGRGESPCGSSPADGSSTSSADFQGRGETFCSAKRFSGDVSKERSDLASWLAVCGAGGVICTRRLLPGDSVIGGWPSGVGTVCAKTSRRCGGTGSV